MDDGCNSPEPKRTLFEDVQSLLAARQYDEANAVIDKRLKSWPEDPEGLEMRVLALDQKIENDDPSGLDRRWNDVLSGWSDLRVRFPNRPWGFIAGGRALIKARKFGVADQILSLAKERFPDHPLGFYYYALSASARNDVAETHRRFGDAWERFPEYGPIAEGMRKAAALSDRSGSVEPVRLVVWDLDETFWKGTVTEGGIKEYIQKNHDAVIELAHRGIMSSILTKNEYLTISHILTERGIWDYFIFPSISWESKGVRMEKLVDAVQLRGPSVLFIDDNPNNRAEVAAAVPGIQIEDESFAARILSDPRFRGKPDAALSRLKQYKLLEKRDQDKKTAVGSNEEFLRRSDIRVIINYDVENSIDRAIELVNRTNQLNYTKRRLPENITAARELLGREIKLFDSQAGLVSVIDNYGDYGIVGFFLLKSLRRSLVEGAVNATLRHFCFSCRTLGMFIEKWVYDYLGRPQLDVVGEVLTDLSAPRKIDWVRRIDSNDRSVEAVIQKSPKIVLTGGCETNSVAVYLNSYTDELRVFGSYVVGGCFVRMESAISILSMHRTNVGAVADVVGALELPIAMVANDLFSGAEAGSIFIFNFGRDAHSGYYLKHKASGMCIVIEPRHLSGGNLVTLSEEELNLHLEGSANRYDEDQKQFIIRASRYVKENFEIGSYCSENDYVNLVREVIECVPHSCKAIITCDHDIARSANGELIVLPVRTTWRRRMEELVLDYPHAGVVSYTDVINSSDEIQGVGNHYDREVFLRVAQRILEKCGLRRES